MAAGKKSFVLYSDYKDVFSELSDKDAGQLIKHIFSYVNDENPVTNNPLVKLSFIPIKNQLKRDLKDWDETRQKRSDAGKAGMAKRWHNDDKQTITNDNTVINPITKITVNDNVTVNVNDTIKNIDIDFALELPEQKINNAIEYLSRTRKTEADRDLVLTLWTAFKEKNFTGEKFYKSEAKIFGHFFETLKFEKINGHQSNQPSNRHKGAMQLVASLKQDYAGRKKDS